MYLGRVLGRCTASATTAGWRHSMEPAPCRRRRSWRLLTAMPVLLQCFSSRSGEKRFIAGLTIHPVGMPFASADQHDHHPVAQIICSATRIAVVRGRLTAHPKRRSPASPTATARLYRSRCCRSHLLITARSSSPSPAAAAGASCRRTFFRIDESMDYIYVRLAPAPAQESAADCQMEYLAKRTAITGSQRRVIANVRQPAELPP